MPSISNLFGDSPFVTLIEHGRTVNDCVRLLGELFSAVLAQDVGRARELADQVERLETVADELQTSLQEQLAAKALVPVDKHVLFKTVERQDRIADRAEDIAVAATCRSLSLPPPLSQAFMDYLGQVVEGCDLVGGIMDRLDLLMESSFRGRDALTVSKLITEVNEKEDRIKAMQTVLVRKILDPGVALPAVELVIWWQILSESGRLATAADQTAGSIRLMLQGH